MKRVINLLTRKWKRSKVTPSFSEEVLDIPKDNTHYTIKKLRSGEELSVTDIGIMLSDIFKTKAIGGTFFKIRKVLIEDAIFELTSVRMLEDKEKNGGYVVMELSELTHGIRAYIHVAPEDFHDFFQEYNLKDIGNYVNSSTRSSKK